jgi:hypothetical protein
MPIIVEFTYKDGSKEKKMYPAELWRLNDNEVTKAIQTEKELKSILIDPDLETADVDVSNNSYPAIKTDKFSTFKAKVKTKYLNIYF